MGQNFYRNSIACVLVFDLTSKESFSHIESWRTEFLNALNLKNTESYPFILFGNKSDLSQDIAVTDDIINNYCAEHNNMPYFATSAKNDINLEEGFQKVADMAYEQYTKSENELILPETKVLKVKKEEKKGCCK